MPVYATPINVKQVLRENGAFDGVQFLHTPLSALAAALRPGAGAFRRLASGPRLKRGVLLPDPDHARSSLRVCALRCCCCYGIVQELS